MFYTLPSRYIYICALRGCRVRYPRPNDCPIGLLLCSLARCCRLASSLLVTLTGNTIISFRKGVAEVSGARTAGNRVFGARLAGIGGAYVAGARLLGVTFARFTSRSACIFFIFCLLKISLEISPSLLHAVSQSQASRLSSKTS